MSFSVSENNSLRSFSAIATLLRFDEEITLETSNSPPLRGELPHELPQRISFCNMSLACLQAFSDRFHPTPASLLQPLQSFGAHVVDFTLSRVGGFPDDSR